MSVLDSYFKHWWHHILNNTSVDRDQTEIMADNQNYLTLSKLYDTVKSRCDYFGNPV